jgi:phage tail protein X
MGQEPSQIRQEIEETRAEMGDTVDALAYKTDVKTRVKESISDKRERLIEQVQGTTHKVGEATPDGVQVKEGAQQAVGVAQENPLGLAIGGIAAGFLAGMMLPGTKVEDEKVGPIADQVKETAAETGQEALERGREVASQVAEQAVEGAKEVGEHAKEVGQQAINTAKEAGQEQAEELKDSAKEGAQEVREQGGSSSPSGSTPRTY